MSRDLIWAFFLQLSDHMWADAYHVSKDWYLPPTPYTPENNVDLPTWDKMVPFLAERKYNMVVIDVGDGLQYDSHPEISAPDAWSKDFLRQKLAELRAVGLEPIPKLNFSTRHSTWLKDYARMISTPAYYQVCADLIGEVCEVFDSPRLFHLGLDEESVDLPLLTGVLTIRHDDVFWEDAYFLFAECEKHGARPWVWGDRYWRKPEQYAQKMPKSVLQSNWFYGYYRDIPADGGWKYTRMHTYEFLDKLGYDQIPCCSCVENNFNIQQTVALGKDRLSEERLKGFLAVPWVNTMAKYEFRIKNDAHKLFVARETYFPETL